MSTGPIVLLTVIVAVVMLGAAVVTSLGRRKGRGAHAASHYGAAVPLPRGGSGEIVVQDRAAPRSVNVGFIHEA